jgi:hypothetical protein
MPTCDDPEGYRSRIIRHPPTRFPLIAVRSADRFGSVGIPIGMNTGAWASARGKGR